MPTFIMLLGLSAPAFAAQEGREVRQVDLDELQGWMADINTERKDAEAKLQDVEDQAQQLSFDAAETKETWDRQCSGRNKTQEQEVACSELSEVYGEQRATYYRTVARAARMLANHHREMSHLSDEAAPLALSLGVISSNAKPDDVQLSQSSNQWAEYLYTGVSEMDAEYEADVKAAQDQIQGLLESTGAGGPIFSGHGLAANLAVMGAKSRQLAALWGDVAEVLDIVAQVPNTDILSGRGGTMDIGDAPGPLTTDRRKQSWKTGKAVKKNSPKRPTGRAALED